VEGRQGARRHSREWLRFAGNVFLGAALGLIAYSPVTDVASAMRQQTLRTELPARAMQTAPDPRVRTFQWEGWATQDRAYWHKLGEGGAFGRLVIPRMNLDTVVVKGTSRETLKKGPGWIEWTRLPGPTGTAGIAGHRVTWLHPFREIDRLQVGDTITFYSPYRAYTYRVIRKQAVSPSQTEVMRDAEKPRLVLSACHPPYSARLRLVVTSELVSVEILGTGK
jgi:sortase A